MQTSPGASCRHSSANLSMLSSGSRLAQPTPYTKKGCSAGAVTVTCLTVQVFCKLAVSLSVTDQQAGLLRLAVDTEGEDGIFLLG